MKKIIYQHKPSTNEYLLALINFPNFVSLLKPTGEALKLYNWLLDKKCLDNDLPLPSIKELSLELEVTSFKLTKYLKLIYEDIVKLNVDKPLLFKKESEVLCYLTFKYLGAFTAFYIGLNKIPNEGDHLYFDFIKPKLGCGSFYVESIYHELNHLGQSITIDLSSELPNTYFKLLKEKAYLNRHISFMDFIDDDNAKEFQEKLVHMYKNL